jgi:hypothetical protein
VKSEVQVQVVPLLPHPKQQQQLEGHKQPTTVCNQAPTLLERVTFIELKIEGKGSPVLNRHMKLCKGIYIWIEIPLDGLQNLSVCGGRREKSQCPYQKAVQSFT